MINIIFLVLAFVLSAVLGKLMIPVLTKLKVGQNIRYDGPRSHMRKQGTPTMGGVMIIIALLVMVIISSFVIKDSANIKGFLAIAIASIGFGIIGFIDDFKKIVLKNTEGLSPKLKMFGLLLVSVAYTFFLLKVLNIETTTIIPFINYELNMPLWVYVCFTVLVMLSTTNAVNLTDGVDGLAGSVTTIISIAIGIIAYRLGNPEVTMFASILTGSIFGFLIYNFYKAKVMMGDTGSLFIGGALATMLIYLKMPIWLLIIAIIPVIEAISDILQVICFRLTNGKRLFKMAPLHHHFELSGWRENKVVAVFSFITLVFCIIGVAII